MRRRTTVTAGIVALVAVVGVGVSAAAGDGPAVRTETLSVAGVPEPDGPRVVLDATLYLPQQPGPAPAVLLAHGFGGSKADLDGEARRLAGLGYVALAWTARGFGRSGGLIHLNAPDYEVADARRLVDLLATRPEVLRDADGDPRVGVAGGSYGGGIALMLAGYDPRVDAIAPQITWNELEQALFPQSVVTGAPQRSLADVEPVPDPGVFKKVWAGVFFSSAGSGLTSLAGAAAPAPGASQGTSPGTSRGGAAVQDDQEQAARCGRFAPDLCAAYQTVAQTGVPTADIRELLAASSPARVLDRIAAPTLLVQGLNDSLFPLSHAEANARGIAARGTPVKTVWYEGGHDGGTAPGEEDRIRERVTEWFDRYLRRDGSAADTRFELTVPDATLSTDNTRPVAQVRTAPRLPGVPGATGEGAVEATFETVPLTGAPQVAVAPPGGSPAAVTALPGIGGALGSFGAAGGGTGLAALPGQVATFESAPLERTLSVVGASRVRLRVTSLAGDATLFAGLWDVAPGGGAVLPSRLVAPVKLEQTGPEGTEVTVSLPAVVQDVTAGHRLRLVVSTTDQAYALPTDPRQYRVELAAAEVRVPTLATTTLVAGGLSTLLPWALGLLALAVGLALAVRFAGRRLRPGGPEVVDGLDGVPIVFEGLGKAYGDGYRAVSDLSFRVEPGQVLGLLGPNGAGKTTTLRMLMGLIRPTEGRTLVFGRPVSAGAPVLSRIGAFVEGPGFLPHATGLENLRLFWGSTGRPEGEAHLAEALEIAGLGEDVHRRVKTYSQGMRQRLAIAQAMLGLPDLLVLDEPTNGLDPPQIREMREVLRRYADTGRTVVVSSHLLSEVEQTCDHVVVMHRGRLVAQGPVSELVGSATALVVDVDDPRRAAAVAATVPGTQDVRVTDTGLTLSLVGTPRHELVRALVDARVEVDRITPQRGLEEAFLALVGES